MNNLRKTMVFLFIGVFIVSMVLVPFTPMANVESQVPQSLQDTQREFVQQWADRVENEMVGEKMDPMLVSYMDTGVVDERMYTNLDGSIKLLLYVDPGFDMRSLNNIAEVKWQIDLVVSRVASATVDSIGALRQLDAMDGIKYIQADRFIDREIEGRPGAETDMFNINDVVGATDAVALGYDGTGVIVGVDDTGIDFSQPDLWGAEYSNGTYPMSYDPSSAGLTSMVIANGSYVENTTLWLEEGNLLTYNSSSGWFVDVSGWDPDCNNIGGGGTHRSLLGGFIGIYEGAWHIANATEYVMSEMWNDWAIPDPAGGQNYTFGWVFQQRGNGYTKLFAPSMIYDGDLIIDWNGTLAWTTMWMEGLYWETESFTDPVARAKYSGMMDWSFVDDIAAGYVHNNLNNILGADLDDDGSIDVSIGSLSWAYDDLGYLDGDYGVFFGITPDWLGWNCLHTSGTGSGDNHGQWTGSAIASRGVFDYEVYDNTTTTTVTTTEIVDGKTVTTTTTVVETSMYRLPGVATGSKLIATKGLSTGSGIMADFWAAGFHLNSSAGPYLNESMWEYTHEGRTHRADIVSNSWGWGPGGSYLQLYYYALMYDMASVPGVLHPDYPGTLFVFSAGNNGNDYGTTGTPGGSYSVVSVGASYTSHYYQGLYGLEQTDGQAVAFSAVGPAFTGVVKPDVMAPGYRGVNPQPSNNVWLDAGPTYYWWQGTSLSCPVAAGVAAIIIDAYVDAHGSKPTPQMLKNLLLSSADDMGYDPFVQGHGLVNALAAVAAIESGAVAEYVFESDSFDNYGAQIAEAWDYWAYDFAPFGIYMPSATPVGMESSSIFFGSVARGVSYTDNLDVWNYAETPVQTGAFDSILAYRYEQADMFSFVLETDTYDDTNFDPAIERPTSFDLAAEMTTLGKLGAFDAATYVTLNVAFDADDIGIYMRLFDWTDTIANGDLNYWNFETDTGDIVDHVSRYTDDCNLLTIRLGDPLGMANLFQGVPALQLDDADSPTNVTVTITLWAATADPDVTTIVDGATGIDVTLDVDPAAEHGVHEGFLLFVDGTWSHKVPYSYMVDFNMAASYGTNQTLVDGAGTLVTPYDTGAVTTSFIEGSTRTDESGGIDVFRVNIPYDITLNASIVVIRAEWQNMGTVIDFQMRSLTNSVRASTDDRATSSSPFDPNPTSDLTNTIIWDNGGLVNGSYWFLVYTHVFDGADVPEDIKITFQLYNATTFAPATYANSWTSRTMTTPTAYTTSDVLVGDHVVLGNTWTVPAVTGLPEYHITGTQLSLLSGLYEDLDGVYADPQGTDSWTGLALTSTDLYTWETLEGINAGDDVRVSIDAQDGQDPAFDVWDWEDANSDGLVDLDELGATAYISIDNGGSGTPEAGSYTATVSGAIAMRVYAFGYAFVPGAEYTLTVDTRASVDELSDSGTPAYTEFDTYSLLRNITMTVIYTCYTATDEVFSVDLGEVSFANFFLPVVSVDAVTSLGAGQFNFTWTSTDQNADDTHFYSVWLSADDGVSYQLLRRNLTDSFFVWDSSGFTILDYRMRVRAFSVDLTTAVDTGDGVYWPADTGVSEALYWPGDFSDASSAAFTAGDVPLPTSPTTPPPTTPPPTSPTTGPPPTIDPLLIGLIGGIGVGVVVLLILFLIRKK